MADLPARSVRACAIPLLIALAAGCATLGVDSEHLKSPPPPCASPCQLVATWGNSVRYAPDPSHGGAPVPGLSGRLYLFGQEMSFPLAGDGKISVLLSDETNGAVVQKEVWNIDADTLKSWLRRDQIGWGYTMFLPWTTYRPDMTKLRMRVCYAPAKGAPLYFEGPLTIAPENGVMTGTVTKTDVSKPKN